VGYEADFSFGTAFQFYAFGASTVGINSANGDQELSAVGALPSAVPEPRTSLMLATGLIGLLGYACLRWKLKWPIVALRSAKVARCGE
jgi:hypothetical protein